MKTNNLITTFTLLFSLSSASPDSTTHLTARSCKRFIPIAEPYRRESTPNRVSRGLWCDTAGKNVSLSSTSVPSCSLNSSCAIGISKGLIPTSPMLNWTITQSGVNAREVYDGIYKLAEEATELRFKAVGAPGTTKFEAGEEAKCVPVGSGGYIKASFAMDCVDGRVEQCDDSKQPPEGEVIQVCTPAKIESGKVVLNYTLESVDEARAKMLDKDPFENMVASGAVALSPASMGVVAQALLVGGLLFALF